MNPQSYEKCIYALWGVAASIRSEHPQLSASIKWAVEGINEERDALKLRADNAEYLLRENLKLEGVQ